MAEILFPSLGVLSLLAALCIIGALSTAFAIDTPTGVNFLIAAALLLPRRSCRGSSSCRAARWRAHLVARGLSFEASDATDPRDLGLVGHEGVAEAPLRPAGLARIDGRRVDVVTRGELIDPGERVRVLEVKGNRVVVARWEAPAPRAAPSGRLRTAGPSNRTRGSPLPEVRPPAAPGGPETTEA